MLTVSLNYLEFTVAVSMKPLWLGETQGGDTETNVKYGKYSFGVLYILSYKSSDNVVIFLLPQLILQKTDFIRGVFKKYADRSCHSLSFWLKGVKFAHNGTQRILYVQRKFDTFDFKYDQKPVVMVTLGRHNRPNVIQRHIDVALSQSDYWLFFHIPFRNFCLKAFVLFKVLPFEWNAPFTPFNPWIETVLVCGCSKGSDRRLHRPLQICNIVKLAASQNLLQCGEQEEITGGQIRAVRRMTKHFNGPSVDRFLSRRSLMARRIVMMKQHGLQQGSSFLLRRYWRRTSAALFVHHTFVSVSYREYHLCNAVLFIAASPYALTNISIVSFLFFPLRTQNLMAVLCSTLILMHLV